MVSGIPKAAILEGTEDNSTDSSDQATEHTVRPLDEVERAGTMTSYVNLHKKTAMSEPANFGVVVPGVYRSAYPQSTAYEFLADLNLKTIV
jgi:hypothetical protein